MLKAGNILTHVVYHVPTLTSKRLVVDCETYRTDPANGKLLGVSLCDPSEPQTSYYVALQWYDFKTSTWYVNPVYSENIKLLQELLLNVELIGHNYAYDKLWIDYVLGIDSKWLACTRLMWHMSAAPSGPRPYGLKDAQVELLGWDSKGSVELSEQVEARGGSLREGDHYLADNWTLGSYACLDASSTALLFNHLSRFFDKFDYWWMLEKMVSYSWLLQECTSAGVRVDVKALEANIEVLNNTKEAYGALFMELAEPYIKRLERQWREDRAAKYVSESAKEKFLASWDKQKKFSLASDKDKQELFYESMKFPITMVTDKAKKPATSLEALKYSASLAQESTFKPIMEAYEENQSAETIGSSFAKPWLASVVGGRLHPRFNPCGTVSYRLSGFKPYLLNAPFDEKELLSCFKCDEDWIGLHADFASVEPGVTAHYSQDASLLKVFRDGQGDVYLDLARVLFPYDTDLQSGYDPLAPITSQIKDRFKKQRGIAKIIHLAVQYTGTKYTVSKNLTYAGYPTSLDEADALVQSYWKHFRKVAVMNEALFLRFERQGYLRNVVGRVIQVPTSLKIRKKDGTFWDKLLPRYKDLPNRFIQSSAHDLLSFWVLEIKRLIDERGVTAKAILIDCHDSTSWQCPKDEYPRLEAVFKDALTSLNEQVKMTIPVRIEMKQFSTLAGLKGED